MHPIGGPTLAQDDANPPEGYTFLQRALKERTGIDLAAYKERQMVRRLTGYLKRVGMPDFYALARHILKEPEALEKLKDFVTINVSEFFRNPDRYEVLAKEVLPRLRLEFGALRLWSAGCSIGAEPYSLSILLEEMDPTGAHEVLATDIDTSALDAARAGVYSEDKLKEVGDERRSRYFVRTADGLWQVVPNVRKRVRFRVHDLLRDPYPTRKHLILCRNVVIYFTDGAKEEVFRKLSESLCPRGYLMIGGTESIFRADRYGLRPAGAFLYRRE